MKKTVLLGFLFIITCADFKTSEMTIINSHKLELGGKKHKEGHKDPLNKGCIECHGKTLKGEQAPSCYKCHGNIWEVTKKTGEKTSSPQDHSQKLGTSLHMAGYKTPSEKKCTNCHGTDLKGDTAPSCYICHGELWNKNDNNGSTINHDKKINGKYHAEGYESPIEKGCTECHGYDLKGSNGPSCFLCHSNQWTPDVEGSQTISVKHALPINGKNHAEGFNDPIIKNCNQCHGSDLKGGSGPGCFNCHNDLWSDNSFENTHTITIHDIKHKEGYLKPLESGCKDCHGQDLKGGTGRSCLQCHSDKWSNNNYRDTHTLKIHGYYHKPGHKKAYENKCTDCHGTHLEGGIGPSCKECHEKEDD